MTTKKCGDCIHADICKQVNGGWFSRENIAYCKGFKDRTNYVEVVRCKDCYLGENCTCVCCEDGEMVYCRKHNKHMNAEAFCSDGWRE